MKAYVIKNNEGLYYTTHLGYEEIHTEDIRKANIFNEEIVNSVKFFLDKTTCDYDEKWEVVKITIMEGDLEQELINYKQALELACENIRDMYCSDYCAYTRDERCKGKCCYEQYYDKEKFLNQAKKN